MENNHNVDNIDKNEIDLYIDNIIKYKNGNNENGSIILNCEPFSYGHRNLIEYAAARVKHLYCFIDDNANAKIPFGDRFQLVCAGVDDIKNVTVVPGSKYTMSRNCFTTIYKNNENDLFVRTNGDNYLADIQNGDINPTDIFIHLFATRVAPSLNINILFSGGELMGSDTRAYNAVMLEILPQHGIAFQMIPRSELTDASKIENKIWDCVKSQQFDYIQDLAPAASLLYLREKFEIPKKGYKLKLNNDEIHYTISAISNHGANLFNYFQRRDIKKLYVYGGGMIAGLLSVAAKTLNNFNIAGFIYPDGKKKLNNKPFQLVIDFLDIDEIVDRTVPVLVLESIEPMVRHKLYYHFLKTYYIDDLCMHEFFRVCCVDKVIDITRAAGVGLLLVNKAAISKKPSKHEAWLNKIESKITNKKRPTYEKIYNNCYAPYGYDMDYFNECIKDMKREKKYVTDSLIGGFSNEPCSDSDTGVIIMSDCAGEYVNCADGMRSTGGLWPEASNNIYFIGHTVAFGIGADDKGTIESHLQNLLKENFNDSNNKYNVINYANSDNGDVYEVPILLKKLPLMQGDIVICLLSYPKSLLQEYRNSVNVCKINAYFERPHELGEIFADTMHMNSIGYKQYALAIYNSLTDKGLIERPEQRTNEINLDLAFDDEINLFDTTLDINEAETNDIYEPDGEMADNDAKNVGNETPNADNYGADQTEDMNNSKIYVTKKSINAADVKDDTIINNELLVDNETEINGIVNPELKSYIASLSKYRRRGISDAGAVILNCAPYTNGHHYLIECAASIMQYVYVFVAEDEKSVFPFSDRLELAQANTKDIKNASVVPGGKFIITKKTIETFLNGSDKLNTIYEASDELEIFAKRIAPALRITSFFTAESVNENTITRQYDSAMKIIMKRNGITYKIISRREYEGTPISASWVRNLLREQRFSEIERIVPPATYRYLKDMYEAPTWGAKKKMIFEDDEIPMLVEQTNRTNMDSNKVAKHKIGSDAHIYGKKIQRNEKDEQIDDIAEQLNINDNRLNASGIQQTTREKIHFLLTKISFSSAPPLVPLKNNKKERR